MKFEYFSDTENFAFRVEETKPCSICSDVGIWFDAEVYAGRNSIECVCDGCLSSGALIGLEIEPNYCAKNGTDASVTITYKTSPYPAQSSKVTMKQAMCRYTCLALNIRNIGFSIATNHLTEHT
ncbi:hypothetical protein L1D34_29855 [Vibrio mediterranei]|uniref:hypothetical protein n=1 Tax=Vibrio mediterranei TaxID=689 RepID=UPI001EFC48F2|nr:hypothetical protein [Vibrio mediterranei]MCG9629008.1 hypothetical protein [Vibrio mediterranei]